MHLSVDFGASTIDVVRWQNDDYSVLKTIEYDGSYEIANLERFLIEHGLETEIAAVEKIFITGGKSKFYAGQSVKMEAVSEIDAIGRGGAFLLGQMLKNIAPVEDVVVVSMGTGTCIVHVDDKKSTHLGGTGVGGGTFLALNKQLLGLSDLDEVKALYTKGDRKSVV